MEVCLITFRSVTPAQRAEQLLQKSGIRCALQRTPRHMQEQGCGYSLRLEMRDMGRATALLDGASVSYRKRYIRREAGQWEELP